MIISMLSVISCLIPSAIVQEVSSFFLTKNLNYQWLLMLKNSTIFVFQYRSDLKKVSLKSNGTNLRICRTYFATKRRNSTNLIRSWRIQSSFWACAAQLTSMILGKSCKNRTTFSSTARWLGMNIRITSVFRSAQLTTNTLTNRSTIAKSPI